MDILFTKAFRDRSDAGRQLAVKLAPLITPDMVVLALPRGGVVVGAEIARKFNLPLDILVARKIGHPRSPEYAVGAVTEDGDPVWNWQEASLLGEQWRTNQVAAARGEAHRQRRAYIGDRQVLPVTHKPVVVVDNGVATGLTLVAALRELHRHRPARTIVAMPMVPPDFHPEITTGSDQLVTVLQPPADFGAVGSFYAHFEPVRDEEVRQLLGAYRSLPAQQPLDLPQVNSLAASVPSYPTTSGELAERARRLRLPDNVVDFFASIPAETSFASRREVMERAEGAKVLMKEEADQPEEQLRSYD